MLKDKSLLGYTNLFSPYAYGKNDKITLFSITKKMKKLCCVICRKYKTFEKKISCILEKNISLSIICCKYKNEYEKIFRGGESIDILRILALIENI